MQKDTANKPKPATGGTEDPEGLYEVACPEIEIDQLICYRTHRLRLPKSRADTINKLSPGALRLAGV